MNSLDSEEDRDYGRNIAVISYLWILGWIIALIMNSRKRTHLGSYHIRQALGLILLTLILFWVIKPRIFITLIYVAGALLGILNALKYQQKPLPGIGGLFQDWFKSL